MPRDGQPRARCSDSARPTLPPSPGFFLAATSPSERLSQLERLVGIWKGGKEEEEGWAGGGGRRVRQFRCLSDEAINRQNN